MPIIVRRAVAADAPVIVEYNRGLARESEAKELDPGVLVAGVAAVLGDPARGVYFVAEADGEVVGQLMITTEWSDWRNGWMWWIQSVYVRADHRRLGVFRSLHEHVLAQARQEGVVSLRLYVEEHNTTAQATYQRLGMGRSGYVVLERSPV